MELNWIFLFKIQNWHSKVLAKMLIVTLIYSHFQVFIVSEQQSVNRFHFNLAM